MSHGRCVEDADVFHAVGNSTQTFPSSEGLLIMNWSRILGIRLKLKAVPFLTNFHRDSLARFIKKKGMEL